MNRRNLWFSQILYIFDDKTEATTSVRSIQVTDLASFPILRESVLIDDLTWQTVGVCERAAASLLLIGLAPVVLVCVVAVWLLSGRAPMIAHKRVGWRGSALWMLKLRTMWDAAPAERWGWVERIDDEDGPGRKSASDSRVPCAFARFCRRHSIDEIPQLWHVICGEMALVGPRPVTAREIREYYGAEADEMLQVKPGIAGLWQTSGRNRLTYRERRAMDLEFVRRRTVRMYFRILLRTLPEVWSGANAC
jgi:exopolysaccharide production protein ExoY